MITSAFFKKRRGNLLQECGELDPNPFFCAAGGKFFGNDFRDCSRQPWQKGNLAFLKKRLLKGNLAFFKKRLLKGNLAFFKKRRGNLLQKSSIMPKKVI